MNPDLLFVRESADEAGDILWGYATRDARVSGISYDHRMPEHVARQHGLTIRYVVDGHGN